MVYSSVLLLSLVSSAVAAIEESSKFEITSPKELIEKFKDGVVPGTPALFGEFAYGHGQSIGGRLFYADPADDLLGCSDFSAADIAKWPQGGGLVVMVNRGNCTFVQKVRHVQNAGGAAAIIVDNKKERGGRLPYMADDNTGNTITIPSMLIHMVDGQTIKDELKALEPKNILPLVKLSWNLPNPDNRVEWDFWTSSDNPLAERFKLQFAPVAESLGDRAFMTPHYEFIDGGLRQYDCFNVDPSASRDCGNQCTNKGRYCNFDPDGDLGKGLNGSNIVRENLRQICLWNFLNETNQHLKWWDYIVAFKKDCESETTLWGEKCSFNVMSEIGLVDGAAKVAKCIKDSGGYGDNDGENRLIRNELDEAIRWNIFYYPTIQINNRPYRGSLSCDTKNADKSFDRSKCKVLEAFCLGYADGTQPDTCLSPAVCAIGVLQDDCKRCGGTCMGCEFDNCGICYAKGDNRTNKICSDCNGVPNGPALDDACGICNGQGKDICGLCGTVARPRTDDPAKCPKDGPKPAAETNNQFPIWAVVLIVVVLVALVAGVVCYYVRKRDKEMRQDIDSLLKQYLPMENEETVMQG